MPVFRPSVVVNLKLFFDEQLTLVAPKQLTSVDARVADMLAERTRGGPPKLIERGAETASWVRARVPKSAGLEFPGLRQAGKFHCTFDFRELPIDPRTVRSAAVEFHLGTVSDADFGAGMTAVAGPRSSVLRAQDPGGTPNSSTLRMVGMVDEWEVTHDDTGSIVHVSGRDLRGVLLDTPVAVAPQADQTLYDQLDMTKPINEVVVDVLRFCPFFDLLQVVVNPAEWPDGVVPAPGDPDILPRHRKGAKGGKRGADRGNTGHGNRMGFWDLVVRLCNLVGAVPTFQGTELHIRPATTIFDQLRGAVDPLRNPTPFAQGRERDYDAVARSAIAPKLRVRRMVYGRDVSSFRFNRQYAGWRRPQYVRAVSIDYDSPERGRGKLVEGIWPPLPENLKDAPEGMATGATVSGKQGKLDIVNIPVPDVKDARRLQTIARAVYEEIGRGEMGGSVETKNLASFGGDNTDPDLLRLAPGDGIEMMVDTRAVHSGAPLVSTFTDHNRTPFATQVAEIDKLIGDENLSRVIVATSRGAVAELQRFFRVQNVKYDWDDKGIKLAFDFQNYVVPRNQVEDAPVAKGAAQRKAVPPNG